MNRYIVHLLLILFYIFLQDYAQKLVSTNRCSQWKRGQLNEHAHCWNHLLLIWICFLWALHGHRKNQFIGFAFRESPTNMKDVKCTNGRSHSSYMQCKLSLHCLLITSFNWMDMRLNIFSIDGSYTNSGLDWCRIQGQKETICEVCDTSKAVWLRAKKCCTWIAPSFWYCSW